MKENKLHKQYRICFKRWTRSPWSIFSGLRLVIHVICINIRSFKNTLFKQSKNKQTCIVFYFYDSSFPYLTDFQILLEKELINQCLLLEIIENQTTKNYSENYYKENALLRQFSLKSFPYQATHFV